MPKSILRRLTKRILITTNLVAAALFTIGCYSEWFFSANWWPVGFLTISLFYILIVLLAFFIFWLFVKAGWSLIFVVTAAISFKHIRNIIPFRATSDFNMQKQAGALRIMDWNVAQFNILETKQNPATHQQMIQLINEYQPDIACFQEMVCADTLVDINTPYYHKYSFFPVYYFVDVLHLPYYFYTYDFKDDFMQRQHFGIIIFSKYPIINKQTISNYPHDYNSVFQYADIVKEKDTFRVFNIHLQSLKFSLSNLKYIDNPSLGTDPGLAKSKSVLSKFKTGFLKRQVQADNVRIEIDKSPYPVIVCGDFNDVPNSYPYETIGRGLQDAFVEKGSGMGRTFSGISPTLRIDNIFVDKRYKVEQFFRIAKKLSDHFPLITDLTKQPE